MLGTSGDGQAGKLAPPCPARWPHIAYLTHPASSRVAAGSVLMKILMSRKTLKFNPDNYHGSKVSEEQDVPGQSSTRSTCSTHCGKRRRLGRQAPRAKKWPCWLRRIEWPQLERGAGCWGARTACQAGTRLALHQWRAPVAWAWWHGPSGAYSCLGKLACLRSRGAPCSIEREL